jgi:hypothetical protein
MRARREPALIVLRGHQSGAGKAATVVHINTEGRETGGLPLPPAEGPPEGGCQGTRRYHNSFKLTPPVPPLSVFSDERRVT